MSRKQPSIAKDWYHQSFDSLYPIIYAHRTIESARAEALFSIECTDISPDDAVLDLCCGNGRHMAHLVERARHVVGLDFSAHLLELAQESVGDKGFLVRGDMRHLPFENAFDVVMNYFTSFGYFENADENFLVVEGLARGLKPDGRFFIDYLNRNWAEQHVEPHSIRRHEGFEIREDRWIDKKEHRINKTTIVLRDGKELGQSGESVKLYALDELTDLLERGGLRVEQTFGDYTGTDCCDPSKPRMIIVGRKV